jgi:DNA-binding CsgD family transcriptional regulator
MEPDTLPRIGIVGMPPLLARALSAALADELAWQLAVMPGFDAADAYVLHPHDEAEAIALRRAMPAQTPSLWLGHGPRDATASLSPRPQADGNAGGAVALLAREATPQQLRAAMTAVLLGLHVHDPSLHLPQTALARGPVRGGEAEGGGDDVEPLTTRELEVYELLAKGLSNRDVAGVLAISAHTAKFHVGQILAKVGAATRAEAVAIGLRLGLIGL